MRQVKGRTDRAVMVRIDLGNPHLCDLVSPGPGTRPGAGVPVVPVSGGVATRCGTGAAA